ncbi:system protein B [Seminavis robusta]|uniref:System protein B n=1 Tax=Seminavis robusta TaxID=568900 RepID=A0A9N8HYG4_9STRA|nr:system protein B [Seminavis robusta]|eukprot:Sro2847_g338440.1 system protein B (1377) ;mRNA; r:2654-7082
MPLLDPSVVKRQGICRRRLMVLALISSKGGLRSAAAFVVRSGIRRNPRPAAFLVGSSPWHPAESPVSWIRHPTKPFGVASRAVSSLRCQSYDEELEEDAGIHEEVYVEGMPLIGYPQNPESVLESTKAAFEVTAPFMPQGDQPAAIEQLLMQLEEKDQFSTLQGITGTGKTLVMSHVIAKYGRPTLVLCHNKTLAAQLARELRAFLGNNAVELFVSYYNHYIPESFNEATGNYNAKKSSINHDIDSMRHRATRALLIRNDVVIVASVSCIYGLGLPEEYLDASRTLTVGDAVGSSWEDFTVVLAAMLYQHAQEDNDFGRGTYQVDDSGIDHCDISLWPPHESFPLRIRLERRMEQDAAASNSHGDGDEKEAWFVQSIEQGHGAGHDPVESMGLFPAKHHVMSEERVEAACLKIEEECEQRVKELTGEGKHAEANRLQTRVLNDVQMMRETGYCSGAENYSRHLAGRLAGQPPSTLMDYLSLQNRREWLLMMDESHATLPQLRAMYGGDRARKERLVKHGYRLPSALDNRPLKESEFWERVQQTVFISATPGRKELDLGDRDPVEMVVRPTFVCDPVIQVKGRDGQLSDLVEEVKQRAQRQERTLAVALTKRDAEDLSSYLNEQGVPSTFIHCGLNTQERADALKSLQSGDVDALVGVNLLREGLDLPQVSLVAILNADAEGFLRSETALLQMVGRAARNVQGTAVFYANRMTKSMQKCIDATNLRRQRQLAYNRENDVKMVSTTGSSMLSIFDLLKDQIAEEQPLEVVGRKTSTSSNVQGNTVTSTIRPDGTVAMGKKTDINTSHIPSSPGVYFWKDKDDRILYVGKAKRLRQRLRSYLAQGAKHTKRINVMMEKACSIDFVLTGSDRDALLLESNLIKHHQPAYNVLLKDDETYPYICASLGDVSPRFFVVPRRYEASQSTKNYKYFGPYAHYREINAVLEGIESTYDLRAKSFVARHGSGDITREKYNELFQQALDENFGPSSSHSSSLAAMRTEFEEAGILFDPTLTSSRDVVALEGIPGSAEDALVHVVQFRNGIIAGRFSYRLQLASGIDNEDDRAAAILHVLERKHYPSGGQSPDGSFSFFPEEVLVQYLPKDTKDLKLTIREWRRKVEPERSDKIVVRDIAKKGKRQESDERAMQFVMVNAKQVAFERSLEMAKNAVKSSVDGTALTELAALLDLEHIPHRIECYDVSHSQGEFAVASRVVFVDGRPVPSLYRKFNIKSVDGPDDYASLEETLARRFKHVWVNGHGGLVEEDDPWALPDVVLIDGGKGQLHAAAKGMAKARVFPAEGKKEQSPPNGSKRGASVALCSLAKNHEELFVFGAKAPVNEAPDSPALLLLRALRDESHRFALSAHRSRRSIRKAMNGTAAMTP